MRSSKLILSSLIILVMAFVASASASAKNGDYLGDIISTDIVTYINEVPITSYNIGGKTVIVAEELPELLFKFRYDDSQRTLSVYYFQNRGRLSPDRVITQSPLYYQRYLQESKNDADKKELFVKTGEYYESDIKVVFNGKPIKGYNLNGQTAVCVEELIEFDGHENEKLGYSKYLCYGSWNPESRRIDIEFPRSRYSLPLYETDYRRISFHEKSFTEFELDFSPLRKGERRPEDYPQKKNYNPSIFKDWELDSMKRIPEDLELYRLYPMTATYNGSEAVIGVITALPDFGINDGLFEDIGEKIAQGLDYTVYRYTDTEKLMEFYARDWQVPIDNRDSYLQTMAVFDKCCEQVAYYRNFDKYIGKNETHRATVYKKNKEACDAFFDSLSDEERAYYEEDINDKSSVTVLLTDSRGRISRVCSFPEGTNPEDIECVFGTTDRGIDKLYIIQKYSADIEDSQKQGSRAVLNVLEFEIEKLFFPLPFRA